MKDLEIRELGRSLSLAFTKLKIMNGMIEAEISPTGRLAEARQQLEATFKFLDEDDQIIYQKPNFNIYVPDDGDVNGLTETLQAAARYFAARPPKYARKRKERWNAIPDKPVLKNWRVLENGNFSTTTSGARLMGLDGPLAQIGITILAGEYSGIYSGLANLTKKNLLIKKGYHSTSLKYDCDDLELEPSEVIVQVMRGNGYCFSTYVIGILAGASNPIK